MGIGTFILAMIALFIAVAAQAEFKKQTGVHAPTRSAMKGIRRRARKKGVSQDQYLDEWIQRKRRKQR